MSAISPLTVEVQEYLRDRRRLGFSLAREGTHSFVRTKVVLSQSTRGQRL